MRHHLWKTAAPTTLIVLGTLTLSACGDDTVSTPGMTHGTPSASTPASTTGDFNDADATFATQMIPHHQQAVRMAAMGARKATTPEVKNLSIAIKAAQDPEIQTLTAWLTAWGKPVPVTNHHDHSTESMPGMMTETEMSDLGNAQGPMFDRMWTELMIEHHKGAITMSKTEQTTGQNPDAIALAKKIQTTQTQEIATLQRLLGRLPIS